MYETKTDSLGTMRKYHPRWNEFIRRLAGPEGCNFRNYDAEDWDCGATGKGVHSVRVLRSEVYQRNKAQSR